MTITCSLFALSLASTAALAVDATPASARPGAAPITSDFDLARHGASSNDGRFRINPSSRSFPKDQRGPHWSTGSSGGPTLELGALGAGRRGAPKLAHIGIYSSF